MRKRYYTVSCEQDEGSYLDLEDDYVWLVKFKGASKTRKSSIPILILLRSTFKIKKNNLLVWSISHLVPKIFWFKKKCKSSTPLIP